jgi:hypothetical protein
MRLSKPGAGRKDVPRGKDLSWNQSGRPEEMAQKIKVASPSRTEDLGGILDYLTAESPRAAPNHFGTGGTPEAPPAIPQIGRVIPEIGDASLREVLAGPYESCTDWKRKGPSSCGFSTGRDVSAAYL